VRATPGELPPYALLFPGQGGQFPGMGRGWHERSGRAREVFEHAETLTGMPIRRLCFDAPRAELGRTQITQPCVFVASLAGLAALAEELEATGQRTQPRFVAGHSLGHFAALVACGALPFASALELVCARGELMAAADPGGMATVIGLEHERVEEICATVSGGAVVVAAVNAPDQTVISGAHAALGEALVLVRGAGAARVVRLPIDVPAHSPAMAAAQTQLAHRIDRLDFSVPRLPVVLNSAARPTSSAAEICAELKSHMCAPVRWWQSLQTMLGAGTRLLVETGPGRSLGKRSSEALGANVVRCLGRSRPAGPLLE
jgi:[acyl-carrier-protein] S-malonyltransferase